MGTRISLLLAGVFYAGALFAAEAPVRDNLKKLVTFILALFAVIAFTSCSEFLYVRPIAQAELKPELYKAKQKANRDITPTGFAEHLENGDWKLSLLLDDFQLSDIKTARLGNEPYLLSLSDEGNKLIITWEVSKERWRNKDKFNVLLCFNDSDNDDIQIRVKHPSTAELTPLAKTVVVICAILPLAAYL